MRINNFFWDDFDFTLNNTDSMLPFKFIHTGFKKAFGTKAAKLQQFRRDEAAAYRAL
jgi:hypothetical protein